MTDPTSWDDEFDVVVVGFGGAGAAAAIQAAQDGARVTVVERFEGGGATCRSGGVFYAGGGTKTQQDVGVRDDAGVMRRYLERELLGKVPGRTLRAFCDASLENARWLEAMGVEFPPKLFTHKTTQPPDGFGLYFSGNERQLTPESPAPRGHVTFGAEMAGGKLFAALRAEAERLGVTVMTDTPVTKLVLDEQGSVVGLVARSLGSAPAARAIRYALFTAAFGSRAGMPAIRRIEKTMGTVRKVRARGGVVLAAGGFMFDDEMVAKSAPKYLGCIPLGTPADDGSGIRLGTAVGAATESLDCCAATRFHCTPESLAAGVAVNSRGKRFCDESLYGASVNREVTRQEGGRAWLIIDRSLHEKALAEMAQEPSLWARKLRDLASARSFNLIYRKLTAALNLNVNRRKAGSLEALARGLGMPAGALAATIEEHNARLARGEPDEFAKPDAFRGSVGDGPYYAIDLRLANMLFPTPCFTLGGLKIDHLTARVLREDGTAIPGLYAAGRNAAGVCAASYVSGLSIADAFFAGRNAGRDARKRAAEGARG